MCRRKETPRSANRRPRAPESVEIAYSGQTEPSGLESQLSALTTHLNRLDFAQLSSEEVEAIEELLERLRPHFSGKRRSR